MAICSRAAGVIAKTSQLSWKIISLSRKHRISIAPYKVSRHPKAN
jgi:hypothetical protein